MQKTSNYLNYTEEIKQTIRNIFGSVCIIFICY